MKTCHRFRRIKAGFEREIGFSQAHAERHAGRPAAKASAKYAISTKYRMAQALNRHISHCPECG